MIIAIDIDEVLADTLSGFIKFYNSNYRTSFRRGQFYTYHWWEVLGIEFGKFVIRLRAFVAAGGFVRPKPLAGAVRGVKKLNERHKLITVTSRPRELAETTENWLEEYFPGCFSDIYYTKELVGEKDRIAKHTVCLQAGVRMFIDDVYAYARGCADKGIDTLLFDCPWNREVEMPDNMRRVESWKEIVKEVGRRN